MIKIDNWVCLLSIHVLVYYSVSGVGGGGQEGCILLKYEILAEIFFFYGIKYILYDLHRLNVF